MTAAEVADAHLPYLSQMQGLRLPICISSRGWPVKLQRLKPQNQTTGGRIVPVNTVEQAGAAKKE